MLAAGLGTRFRGVKQLAPVGPGGEPIMELLLGRAAQSGFGRGVVVVRPGIEDDVERALEQLSAPTVELVVQPEPRGTADAVLRCRHVVDGPFAVVNADDLYPAAAFRMLGTHLAAPDAHALVAFQAQQTFVSDRPVSRARVVESGGELVYVVEQTVTPATAGDQWVSMNMWGFLPSVFDAIDATRAEPHANEWLLPDVVATMTAAGARVRVLRCDEPCIGITYADDVDAVRATLA